MTVLGGHCSIDIRHRFSYIPVANQISPRRTPSGDAGRQGRVRCPRAGPHQPRSRAASGISLPALRPACEVLHWTGTGGAGNARLLRDRTFTSQEAWPELSLGDDDSLWREPWWNAGRRARPQAEGRRKPLSPWRDPRAACVRDMKHCVCRRSASFFLLFVGWAEPAKPTRSKTRRNAQRGHGASRLCPPYGLFDIVGLSIRHRDSGGASVMAVKHIFAGATPRFDLR